LLIPNREMNWDLSEWQKEVNYEENTIDMYYRTWDADNFQTAN